MVFPRRSKKPKQGDSSAEELQTVQQHKGKHVLPIEHEKPEPELVDIPADLKVGRLSRFPSAMTCFGVGILIAWVGHLHQCFPGCMLWVDQLLPETFVSALPLVLCAT